METRNYKEVYFSEYCHLCKYRDINDTDDPCNECLASFVNENSHKPIMFVEADD